MRELKDVVERSLAGMRNTKLDFQKEDQVEEDEKNRIWHHRHKKLEKFDERETKWVSENNPLRFGDKNTCYMKCEIILIT